MTKLKPCKVCGSNHMYLCKHYVCDGIERNVIFCNDCKTSFYNENYEEDEDSTRNWWNSIAERTCKMENGGAVPSSVLDSETVWFCSECGSPMYNDMEPSYCLYCGARVVEGDDE